MSLPSDNECELIVLSVFVNAARGKDRRGGMGETHHASGLPISDMVATNAAVSGEDLAFEVSVSPRRVAMDLVERVDAQGRGQGHLSMIPNDRWAPEERDVVAALTVLMKRTCRRLRTRGLLYPTPGEDGQPILDVKDNEPMEWKITGEGFRQGRQRVKGTRFDHGPLSILASCSPEVEREAPAWARAEHKKEI